MSQDLIKGIVSVFVGLLLILVFIPLYREMGLDIIPLLIAIVGVVLTVFITFLIVLIKSR